MPAALGYNTHDTLLQGVLYEAIVSDAGRGGGAGGGMRHHDERDAGRGRGLPGRAVPGSGGLGADRPGGRGGASPPVPARERRQREGHGAAGAEAGMHLPKCGRQRPGLKQPDGIKGLPDEAGEVRQIRRADAPGRAALRSAGHRQDAPGPGAGGGGRGAVLRAVRVGLRGEVRGRGREPGAGAVQKGPQGRALRDIHRRDRRHGQEAGRGLLRRARPDPERAFKRDVRLLHRRRRGGHRRHEPHRDAGPRAAAPRALRPADRGRSAGALGAAEHP